MEASGSSPLLDTEAGFKSAQARRCWPVRGVVLLFVFVLAVFVGRQVVPPYNYLPSSNIVSEAEVSVAANSTFNGYSEYLPRSCAGQPDGLRWIKPDVYRAIQVFCQGEWVLMQKRTGPSVNFHRDWASYARGFGDETNFWLGNDNLHAMTSGGARLRVVLVDADFEVRYAQYSTFSVAGLEQDYKVVFDDYSGNAGDALTYNSGSYFSTWDQDHDNWADNCAEARFGGWWYDACSWAYPNGPYLGPGTVDSSWISIVWDQWKGPSYSMQSCHMWVQPNV